MNIDLISTQLAGELAQLTAMLGSAQADAEPAQQAHIAPPFSTMSASDWVEAVDWWNRAGRDLITSIEARSCPACGSPERRHLFDSYDGYGYHECAQCGCWYVPLKVEAALFERFFGDCPAAFEVSQRSFAKRKSEQNRLADLSRFDDYLDRLAGLFDARQDLRYLDLGCGLGHSLLAAGQRGFIATGTESSRECLQHCREAGLDVRQTGEPLPDGGFELISFWESLEHMTDPAAMLALCERLLSEDGVIAFTIPNLNSPLLRLQRGDCSIVHGGYDTPGHINLFGPQQVQQLLQRTGFSVLHIDGQYGMSLPELFSYLLGLHRGAADLLHPRESAGQLPPAALAVLDSIGPAVANLERLTLTAPILFVVACRERSAAALAPAARQLDQQRLAHITADAARGTNEQTLVQALQQIDELGQLVAQTQEEVNRRDALLMATQAEVNRRDAMLAEQQEVLRQTQQREVAIQADFGQRDAILAEQQDLLQQMQQMQQMQQEQQMQQQIQQQIQEQMQQREAAAQAQLQEMRSSLPFRLAHWLGWRAGR